MLMIYEFFYTVEIASYKKKSITTYFVADHAIASYQTLCL